MLFSLGNLLFLIYPVRTGRRTRFDFQTLGRMMLFFFLQMLLDASLLLVIPAALGGLAYLVIGLLPGGLRRHGVARRWWPSCRRW